MLYPKSIRVKSFTRRAHSIGYFSMDQIIGGSKACLTRLRHKIGRSIIVVIDNPREIELRRAEFGDNGIYYFAMGDGETTHSLHASSNEATRAASNLTTNTNMYPGFGARLANAARAADILIASDEFQRFLSQLPELVLQKTEGTPLMLHVGLYGSSAGAAFSGTSVKFADVAVKALSYFGCQTQIHFDILGPITFTGVSPRARMNSASSLLSTLGYALNFSERYELRAGKRVFLHEVLPYGNDQTTRNKFLMLDAMVLESVQMQDLLMQPRPNEEQDDCFGAIMSRNVDFKNPLDREHDIASAVAFGFLGDIAKGKEDMLPDLATVKEIHFDTVESSDESRGSEEAILNLIFAHSPESLLKSIARPDKKYTYQMRFETGDDDFVPEHICYSMAEHPQTLTEFLRRLELLIGYRQIATTELAGIADEIVETEASVKALENRFIKAITKASRKRVLVVPHGALAFITELRRRHDILYDLKLQSNAAEIGLVSIESEVTFLETKLAAIEAELKSWIPKNGLNRNLHLVTRNSANDLFGQLMKLESYSKSEKLELLCSSAVQVTLTGLAKIVGSDSSRIEAIADRIVNGPYEHSSPAHGAQRHQVATTTVYALPPCEPDCEDQLRKKIVELNPFSSVVFGDSLAFGACVQRIRFRRFHSVGSLFEGLTGHDLWLAFNDPLSPLNSVDSWKSLKRLGGRIDGERIVFDGPVIERSE